MMDSMTKTRPALALEGGTGGATHPADAASLGSAGAADSPVDSQRFARAGSIQAGTGWFPGQAIYVLQVPDHVCGSRHVHASGTSASTDEIERAHAEDGFGRGSANHSLWRVAPGVGSG